VPAWLHLHYLQLQTTDPREKMKLHQSAHPPARALTIFALGFVLGASTCLTSSAWADTNNDRIREMSLKELRVALDNGRVTSEGLVRAYLENIQHDNHAGLRINAVITLNEAALQQAKQWDAQRASVPSRKYPALAGIPFLAKDNIDTQGIPTTGGSLALRTSVPTRNAFIVQKLVDQGAILIGKTNLSELAASYGWLGYSSVGGQTLNPANPLRSASGSSSGSGAAVAARFSPFALGTDTTGSIRSPASVTGMVGMRSSMGLVSRAGIIPMSLTADVAGAITRTVEDQAVVLEAIAGADSNDAATKYARPPTLPFADRLANSSFYGKTIAVIDNFDNSNPEVDAIKMESALRMQAAGATIVRMSLPKDYANLLALVLSPIGLAEFKPQFEAYLSTLPDGQPKDMSEFMRVLSKETSEGTRIINPGRYKGLVLNQETKTTDAPAYIAILTNFIPKYRSELADIMRRNGLDAIFFPTDSCPAAPIPGKVDPTFLCKGYSYGASKISSATGFPEITVNAGTAAGNAPIGMSFLGAAGDDIGVLQLGSAFEKLVRQKPGVRPSP
jgi:amidase